MKRLLLFFLTLLVLIPCITFSQQAKNTQGSVAKADMPASNNGKYIYEDTTEQGLANEFWDMMNRSETVMYAQVISKEPKWRFFKSDYFPNGHREIYTLVTFKVYQWIKGSIQGDEVTFYLGGGQIGDTLDEVFPTSIYSLNEKAIFYLGNKDPNTFLIDIGRNQVFGSGNGRHGEIFVGSYSFDAEDYVKLVKQATTDTTAYQNYFHLLNVHKENMRLWKLKTSGLSTDSVKHLEEYIRKTKRDTTDGGVK